MYRTLWFLLLILLATVNLVLCSLKRVKNAFSQAFSRPRAEENEALRSSRLVDTPLEAVALNERMQAALRKRGFAVDASGSGSVRLLAAQKGGVSRIGFLVTHLAIILVLISGAINGRLGYRHLQEVGVGESFDVSTVEPSADFTVRVDDFEVETTERGQIRDYKSTLTVIENGEEVVTKVIEVNHPLVYKGLSFYQATYGQEPDRIKDARIILLEDDRAEAILDVPFRGRAPVPNTDLEIAVTDYVPHFVMDLATGTVTSRSSEPRLPAVKADVLRNDEVVDSGWLIMDMDVHAARGELARFRFVDYRPLFYTGLDVASNPGVPLLLVAFAVAAVGIALSFFVRWKRVWVRIAEQEPGRSSLQIIGSCPKDPLAFKSEIDKLYKVPFVS